jgi:hypothetical protein
MLTRSAANAAVGRAGAMRRMRRRTANANRLYCATNGCTSFLVLDESTSTAFCRICGYSRRLH